MRVVITGASGLLGKYLKIACPNEYDIHCYGHRNEIISDRIDITKPSTFHATIKLLKPDVIIHAAAIGSVDFCENNVQKGYEVNVDGAVNVAISAMEIGAKFVFISSNAVYEGDRPPYSTYSSQRAVNAYGRMKIEAELSLKNLLDDDDLIIVRPIMMYGWPLPGGRGNWVTRILEILRDGQELQIVHDTITQPTYAYDVATLIWSLIGCNYSGSVNVGSVKKCSLYEFAVDVAKLYGLDSDFIIPVKSSHFSEYARRPIDTTYNLRELHELGYELGYTRALNHMKGYEDNDDYK